MDSISLLVRALARMKAKSAGIFKHHLDRHGKLIRNNTKEVDCEADPVIPWKLGYDIMKTMREVSFFSAYLLHIPSFRHRTDFLPGQTQALVQEKFMR